ncbi:permease-like cell division protein FtsX [Proteiniclasticum ruminis]|jgi:cell division transport system permease protein|uniref:Cell division protein FtsX n=1 Tax=Proteiniclasticum ruminis TaxID=398199 RepID=A0A1G8IJP2_9CLOT|nr:permease-like cell division protein FtsX [Proteiniclasticum ruminis]MBP9921135.1 permease-like cell division protein FtsX [Proteiniclasticum sp.]SDI19124.1 cell division transport system permease protein [Proteiniclasticum ruminis]
MQKFKMFIIDALKSLKRNKTITFASIITVAATLFIFGVFLIVAQTINMGVESVESKVEIKAYLIDEITTQEQSNIETILQGVEGVKEVTYESKEEAFDKFKERLGEDNAILAGFSEDRNPLPNSFVVSLEEPEAAMRVEEALSGVRGVEDVGNERETVERIIGLAKIIRTMGVVIFIILVLVSLFLISNTIKLTVYSRRREIGIMKFVGATDWFIRWPFLIEGMIMGLIGGIIAVGVVFFAYQLVYADITQSLFYAGLVKPSEVLNSFSWQFGLTGLVIGALGSFIALKRFLDV